MVLRGGVRWVPLMHLTDPHRPIVYGIVQAGEEVPHGVPYIKTGDLNDLRPEVLSRTSREIDQAYRRARVCPGDIVMAMRASIGLCVVVPESLPRANLTQGTARIAPADGIPVRWLYHALGTHAVQERCDLEAVGTTFRTLNIWSLRRIPIPVVDTDHLAETAARMDEREHATERTLRTMDEQVDLLVEHRQALITAAVTGELEVAA
ncbi:MAG: hypothetical protein GY788_15050 [bacterium]|nr:hypothetical protein [bacterium]